jgi:hypothetical protein
MRIHRGVEVTERGKKVEERERRWKKGEEGGRRRGGGKRGGGEERVFSVWPIVVQVVTVRVHLCGRRPWGRR